MRVAHGIAAAGIVAASAAALIVLTAPALSKGSDARKRDDASTPSSCHAYQQEADGSWTERPCEEKGQPAQTEHKPVAKGTEEEPR
jgi:hypothetical protein